MMATNDLHIKRRDKQVMNEYLEIIESDLPEVERVARAFMLVTNFHILEAQKDIELARAMDDTDNLIKEQIKRNVVQFSQNIFNDAYRRVTGRMMQDV